MTIFIRITDFFSIINPNLRYNLREYLIKQISILSEIPDKIIEKITELRDRPCKLDRQANQIKRFVDAIEDIFKISVTQLEKIWYFSRKVSLKILIEV